jgi:hypothetical protein
MTVVNTNTGEIVEFDKAAAERRAERITLRLDAIADNYNAVLPMIREAIEKRDDLALGYRSPGDYVSDRFGQALAGLGIEVRRAVVGELTAAGLSTRAIAPVVGVSNFTVHEDQKATAPVRDLTPEPSDEWPEDDLPTPIEFDPEPVADVTPRPVTGIDGKEYPRPTPAKPKRRPLPDVARDAGYDLRKSVERLERLRDDDRFGTNKDEVAAHLRGHLIYAAEVLADLLDRIDNN